MNKRDVISLIVLAGLTFGFTVFVKQVGPAWYAMLIAFSAPWWLLGGRKSSRCSC